MTRPTVYIHTNRQQGIGALLSAYSMKRASKSPDAFDVRLLYLEETPHLLKREGQKYRRKGREAIWHNEDLQSFSPLRRMVPQCMNFEGRALVIDPDVFAIGDVNDLLTMDMRDKAILCRYVPGEKGRGFYASSVMLLECAKLAHWRWDDQIDAMFRGELDYGPWISLTTEDPSTIGEIGEDWNSFDRLTPTTRLLHNTERSTQPWKTGLPIDFDLNTRKIDDLETRRYVPHPDPNQEAFFFALLRDALEDGGIEESQVAESMAESDVRADAFDILERLGYRRRLDARAATQA